MSVEAQVPWHVNPQSLTVVPARRIPEVVDTAARRRRGNALLRNRPQPVLPVELRHLGDQRGADPAPAYRDGRARRWDRAQTIRRAIEIRNGVIRNPKILSFQRRSAEFPHTRM